MNAPRPDTVQTDLPHELREMLTSLRVRLRRYSLLSGILGLVIAAAVTFWATTGLDFGWFALQQLEMPVALRAALLVVMLGGAFWLLLRGIIIPQLKRIHDRDLALLVERRFPEYQDRLITAVEGSLGIPACGPLVSGMLERTVADATSLSQQTEPERVFNQSPLRQRSWIAAILALSVAGIGAARPATLPRWWNAFVRCEPVYHQRTTALDVRVIAQPDDRRLEFRPDGDRLLYRHPRGSDLELELVVPAEAAPSGRPWIVPERVRVDVTREDGSTSRTYVSPTAERTFRFVITRLQDAVDIELRAGDFRTPTPLRVESVVPPSVDGITLQCDYPAYTRWNELRSTNLQLTGSEASLPIGTRFRLEAAVSKPLQSVRIVTDDFELASDAESFRFTWRGSPAAAYSGPPLLSSDGLFVTTELLLTSDAHPKDRDHMDTANDSPLLPDDVLWIASNTLIRFFLHDQDDVLSVRPQAFRIRGIADRPPAIDVKIDGIDTAVTRRAVIPFVGSIRDDYGLQSAGFEFIIDDQTQWRPRPFSTRLQPDTKAFTVGTPRTTGAASGKSTELFQVQPLDLTEGQTLSVAVMAADGCTIGDANVARSEPILFRVVSNEELLSLLYTREINLRRRFDDVIRELEQARADLAFHEQVARRIEATDSDDGRTEDHIGLTTCATRSGNVVRRQTNELKSILQGFDGIIQQLINNSVPPAQLSQTMNQEIVVPLNTIVEKELPQVDRTVSRFRVAATSRKPATELVRESEQAVGQVIARLKLVLENVKDMAEFHEALSDLKALLEEEKRIMDDTKRLKRQRLIDDL